MLCRSRMAGSAWHRDACRIGVVPQGGNTSLAGAAVPLGKEVVINLSKMNRILDFTPVRLTRHMYVAQWNLRRLRARVPCHQE
jgi:hypothetical protein